MATSTAELDLNSEPLILKHLQTQAYQYKNDAFRDIAECMRHYRDLRFSLTQHLNEFRQMSWLCCLKGVIPVVIDRTPYNFPVEIVLMKKHPEIAPFCYVRPVQSMQIAPNHDHVDEHGRIYLPYINGWRPMHSSLRELMLEIASTFARKSPLHMRVAQAQAQLPYAVQPPSQRQNFGSNRHPIPTPQYQQYGDCRQQQVSPASLHSSESRVVQQPSQNFGRSQISPEASLSNSFSRLSFKPERELSDGSLMAKALLASVRDPLESRLKRELFDYLEAAKVQNQDAMEDKSILQVGHRQLEQMLAKLADESREVAAAEAWYRAELNCIDQEIARIKSHGSPSVDEVVVGAKPLHQQFIRLEAECKAIDSILHELARTSVSVEEKLKHVFSKATEYFLKRQHKRKVEVALSSGHTR